MYLHIVPQLFHLMANKCHLESIVIPELDFKIEGEALSTGRPHPNKNIWVGMKKGRKAINGLLLKNDKHLNSFTAVYQWNIENLGMIKHHVTTYIEDDEFDMVSHDIMLNGGFDGWKSRVHSAYENLAPVRIQPKMESFLNKTGKETHDAWKEYSWGDFLLSREESLLLHTIQSERLNTECSMFRRLPSTDQAIII
ncbi:TPA: hypothetical protein JHJ64_005037 [Enterobacter cloacae]|uniref:DUF6012 family protein n=1 Tax=Enterobacter hormaechei TaxID=158836 RepID=UPI00190B4C19|nr:DUF6012 family protein [Enterobacter hormaechei]HAV2128608.1 hypothetical protein [Enterobacter cloacae]HBR4538499.1 hypothetical protein [Klebsiella pneumoniae]MBK4366980.1 hypothetical protein [Enterobacter hormaechei]MDG4708535.1 DUF6012 family protein [Enterobacter hormaechei]WLZ47461.1 DUF6012 family protein [Enterobacter hormaechei]